MNTELTRFLHARLDEDDRIARAAMRLPGGVPGEQWRVSGSHSDAGGTYWSITNASSDIDRVPTLEMVGSGMSGGGAHTEDVATHIAAHDPARVLREIEAKRKLLDDHPIVPRDVEPTVINGEEIGGPYYPFGCGNCHTEPDSPEVNGFGYCLTWRVLASVYADRPGYREAWRP
jgi:hypothetical protein